MSSAAAGVPAGAGRPLRILVVVPTFPYPAGWGFARRVLHLVDHLAGRHEVTVLSFVHPDVKQADIQQYRSQVHRLVTVPVPDPRLPARRRRQALSLVSPTPYHVREVKGRSLQRAFDGLVADSRFDLVLLESGQLGWLRVPPGLPVVVDEHNVESELLGRMAQTEKSRLRRAYNTWETLRYRRHERRVWQRVSACVATSQLDADTIRARTSGLPVRVVPNGVDPQEFRPAPAVSTPSLVFTGLLSYRPNADGIGWFLDEVFPRIQAARPGVELTVVGSGTPEHLAELSRPGVTCTGWVTDVKPYVRDAAVAVVPLRMGGGTRLKIVEAMSMAKAIVSTTVGAEGLDVVSGQHLQLRDEPEAFADSVVALLDDPGLRERMGHAARLLVEERYSWARAGEGLEALMRSLVADPVADPDRSPVG